MAKIYCDQGDKSNVIAFPTPPLRPLRPAVAAAIAAYNKSGKMLDAALAYAHFGVPVFPLDPVTKAPIPAADKDSKGNKIPGTGSFYKATCDPLVINKWWRKHPRALIGMPMGPRSGVWCLDIDTAEDHDDGVVAWQRIAKQHARIKTREHRSATGGPHLIFTWDPKQPVRCSPGGLPAGISVKGEGGYIVVPPSMRKQRSYTVFRDIDPIDAPAWLIELIKPRRLELWTGPTQVSADLEELTTIMTFVPNDDLSWEEWTSIGMALFAASKGQAFDLFDAWSKLSAKYDRHNTRERWQEISRSPPTRTGVDKLRKIARTNGWNETEWTWQRILKTYKTICKKSK